MDGGALEPITNSANPNTTDQPMTLDQMSLFAPTTGASDSGAETAAYNFRLMGRRKLGATWRERAADNITAMKLANKIIGENRSATAEEQEKLIRFVGFGATDLSKLFGTDVPKGYEVIKRELMKLVTGQDRDLLARSVQYAHYTPEFMVNAIWRGLRRLGFNGGAVLEGGCGTGMFVAMMPEGVAMRSSYLGVEMDPTTAHIAKLLYPESDILISDFAKATLPAGFDLAIGNPPFSNVQVSAKDSIGKLNLSLHNYFIARSIERLRPGGLAAFVVSRYLMDAGTKAGRECIAGMADLLGAIRMPEGAMRAAAGTDVVVDILFLRKREDGEEGNGADWIEASKHGLKDAEGKVHHINSYWARHPRMVLGRHHISPTSQYGKPVYTCKPSDVPLDIALANALHILPEKIYKASAEDRKLSIKTVTLAAAVEIGTAATGARVKEGSYFVDGEVLYQVTNGTPMIVRVRDGKGTSGIFKSHAKLIRDWVPIRDAIRDVLQAQSSGQPFLDAQARLNAAYDRFVKLHGPLNAQTTTERVDPKSGETKEYFRYPNISPVHDDPDCWLVACSANYDSTTGVETKGPFYSECVVAPPPSVSPESAHDALAVVLNERGMVDIRRIAEMMPARNGVEPTVEDAIRELGTSIYLDPQTEAWVTEDEYLSGMVRDKLAAAREAAKNDKQFERNVDALEAAQPPDLDAADITARLGAPWIPGDVIQSFIKEIIGITLPGGSPVNVYHTAEIGQWSIQMVPFVGTAAATTDWGTARRHAGELLLDALSGNTPTIYDTIEDPLTGNDKRVLNEKETQAAKDKFQAIKDAFAQWIWTDADRTIRLCRIYNQEYNNLVPRVFNGEHLVLPGASNIIDLRRHQKRAVWREICVGSTYWSHVVGSGKTFGQVAALMEQRRLGLIRKPMVVVPSHTLAQWAREWLLLYPQARILTIDTEENFKPDDRKKIIARATLGDWDGIIITHSAFKFIPVPQEFEERMLLDQLKNYEVMMGEIDEDDRISVKKIERLKEGLQKRLEKLQGTKDNMVHMGEIGIDKIVVDEAQEFRKLSFPTNRSNLKGIDPEGSGRAWDLYVKSKFIAAKAEEEGRKPRPLSLMSGTPITNTMGELFSLLRFMHEAGLALRNVQHFDAWAATFGDTKTELELQPSGNYKPVERFSEFVNIPELIAMFRDVADVVLAEDLRDYVALPAIKGGQRQIVKAPASPAFKNYQKILAARIAAIEKRGRKPEKGDDIILTVIGDGRHSAIDLRLVNPERDLSYPDIDLDIDDLPHLKSCHDNDPSNKLNALIDNAFRIWQETADLEYTNPSTGAAYQLKGAAQMIFSDLGTENAEVTRGFSAYKWIRRRLIGLGVPAEQIAFMQHYKKTSEKQRLFQAVNAGQVRFLIGSSETMGTGVNAQQRLYALHHLDVPWLPSHIQQREGRIERQGNQHKEICIFAYATLGSMDATMWQTVERKMRFIDAVLRGDRTVRRLEDLDADSAADQFAIAKALASGDDRLIRKAGLEQEIARLERQRSAHNASKAHVKRTLTTAKEDREQAVAQIEQVKRDIAARNLPKEGEYLITFDGKEYTDRKEAREAIAGIINTTRAEGDAGQLPNGREWDIGEFAGFAIQAEAWMTPKPLSSERQCMIRLYLKRAGNRFRKIFDNDLKSADAILSRMEEALAAFEDELLDLGGRLARAQRTIADFERKEIGEFQYQAMLDEKKEEWVRLTAELAASDKAERADRMKMAA